MGTRRDYARGVFCWVDLTTSDTDAATISSMTARRGGSHTSRWSRQTTR